MAIFRIYQSVAVPDSIDFRDFGEGTITKDASKPGKQFSIAGESESFDLDITVNGRGFTYVNPNDNPDRGDIPQTGVVTSIDVNANTPLGSLGVFDLTDVSISIEAILAAASTPKDFSDDRALIEQIFSGEDQIFGSDPDSFGLNTGDDILAGYVGNDTIDGGGGADTMNGGKGNDFVSYQSSSVGVTVDLSNLANNTGDADGDVYNSISGLIGSKFADTITGSDGAETINGGGGIDDLTGNGGTDSFEFDSKLGKKGPTITDFDEAGDDRLLLSKTIFTKAKEDGPGVIESQFAVLGDDAVTGKTRFIYNDDNGKLFYDSDGSGDGKQKLVAIFEGGVDLARTDLELI